MLRGNGVETRSEYDADNFRLMRIRSVRKRDGRVLQDQRYTYDAAGNTIHVADNAQQTIFFNNAVVEPDRHFVYDALHRLREASGREHAQVPTGPREHELPPARDHPQRSTGPAALHPQVFVRQCRQHHADAARGAGRNRVMGP